MSLRMVMDNNVIYLTNDPLPPSYVIPLATIVRWPSTWANQSNTNLDYNGLITPPLSALDALNILVSTKTPISVNTTIQGELVWIDGVDNNGGKSEPISFFVWNKTSGSQFYLQNWNAGRYSLILKNDGQYISYPNCESISTSKEVPIGVYDQHAYFPMTIVGIEAILVKMMNTGHGSCLIMYNDNYLSFV
jgi:hypothetical protein